MNIDTLLEAAIYLEQSHPNPAKTRDNARDFHGYAKSSQASVDSLVHSNSFGSDRSDKSLSPSGDDSGQRRRAGGAGTREVHNKLEKNRRAHLKECFEMLKHQIPALDDKKTSNLSILRSAFRYIQVLKRKEKEFEQETQRLAREKIAAQERIAVLKRELAAMNVEMDINHFIQSQKSQDLESHSTSTATADNDSPIMSEEEEESPEEGTGHVSPQPVPDFKTLNNPVINSSARPSKRRVPSPMYPSTVKNPVINKGPKMFTAPVTKAATTTSSLTSMASPAAVTTTTTNTTLQQPQTFKTPVTQILQQTLQQRALQQQLQQQQLQQQQLLQQQQKFQLQQQQQKHTNGTQQVFAVQANSLHPMAQTVKPMTQLRQAVAINHVVPSIMSPGTSILAATPAGSLAAVGHSPISQASALAAISKIVTSTVTTSVSSVPVPSTTSSAGILASHTQQSAPVTPAAPVTIAGLKHLIAPGSQISAQLVSPATQMSTISQLMSQAAALPRTSTMGASSVNNGPVSQMVSPTVTQMSAMHPVMTSLTHVTPVTQLVSPMTVVSPAVQVSPGLTQTQLSSVVNSSVIKSLGQIPIIQQPFNISQMVKPVVMVTMPNVVTTSLPSVVSTFQTAAPNNVQVTVPNNGQVTLPGTHSS